MKRSFIILFLLVVGVASSISAGSGQESRFTKISVSPLYRLPGTDITVEWSTPSQQGISIVYGDTLITGGSEGKYVIPASELSNMPESFTLRVLVNAKDGEKKKVEIQTFTKPHKITISGEQEGLTERFLIHFKPEVWDSNLVIQKVELDYPKAYYFGEPVAGMHSRPIFTKWEYFDSTRTVDGYLREIDRYESTRGLPAKVKGTWTFYLWNYPWRMSGGDFWPNELSPDVVFTIGAAEEDK